MLDIKNCCLVVVDIQDKLAKLMYDRDQLFKNIQILIKSSKLLGIPVIWTQQVPQALGQTVARIAQLLTENEPIDKAAFSCCREEKFLSALSSLNRRQVLLCGIETHICIYQTALDLLGEKYHVGVIADAVSSRTKQNKQFAIDKMLSDGINIFTVEMALFELMKTSEHPQFKDIAELVK